MRTRVYFILISLISVSAVFSGCFMWGYVQQGYKNFSAYFNTYYNAQTAFDKGLTELKNNLKENEINQIAGSVQTPFQISPTIRQNFDLAIAKASKVLQLYPMSEFTEDCLFMIGISYYYEGDNLQGQRKFVEAESTFPKSKRVAEARMYYGSMLIKSLNYDQGLKTVEAAQALARKEKNQAIVTKCSDILSDYFLSRGDTVRAAAYLDTAATQSKDDQSAIYACQAGNLLMAIGRYNEAEQEYQKSWNEARDIRLRFYSKYYLARAERMEGHFNLALSDVARLRGDDKFFQFFPLLEYQRAAVLYDSGKVSTAVQAFQKIDTAYATSEASTRSTFRLGNIYLRKVGDYQTALKYYQKCSGHPSVVGLSDRAREMAMTLQDYFIRSYRVALSDSLYDRARIEEKKKDSATVQSQANLDSLYEHAAGARRDLAGYYMFRLRVPDSAIVSYRIIVDKFQKSREYPSALYTLGEYYYSTGDSADGRKYLQELVKEHPESEFAASASLLLDMPPPPVKIDSSQVEYDQAIELVNQDHPDSALTTLRKLASSRSATVAPQALYAAGWVYEHKLREPDSAFVYYKRLQTEYPSSNFTTHVALALTGYEQAQFDSAAARQRREMARKDSLSRLTSSEPAKGTPQTIQPAGRKPSQVEPLKHSTIDSLSISKDRLRILREADSTKKAVGEIPPRNQGVDSVQKLKQFPIDSIEIRHHILKDSTKY
ncbi:MAG: tetratricopeptide repeat protein [Bacteroidetes bacterium]|nr:tetratricopeptide repeat protein [Bacteroidota bacterium]